MSYSQHYLKNCNDLAVMVFYF